MSGLLKEAQQTIKYWWLFLLLGIFLIIGGIWVMRTPVGSYITLSIFFSIMVFVNGIFDVIFSLTNRKIIKGWGWYLTGGILEIFLGILLMNHPSISMSILPLILGFWLMYGAVSTISGALDLKSFHIGGWIWILLLGVLLLIMSFFVIADPIFGSGSIVAIISISIIFYGIAYVLFALKLREIKQAVSNIKHEVLSSLEDLKSKVLKALESKVGEGNKTDQIENEFDSFKDSLS